MYGRFLVSSSRWASAPLRCAMSGSVALQHVRALQYRLCKEYMHGIRPEGVPSKYSAYFNSSWRRFNTQRLGVAIPDIPKVTDRRVKPKTEKPRAVASTRQERRRSETRILDSDPNIQDIQHEERSRLLSTNTIALYTEKILRRLHPRTEEPPPCS